MSVRDAHKQIKIVNIDLTEEEKNKLKNHCQSRLTFFNWQLISDRASFSRLKGIINEESAKKSLEDLEKSVKFWENLYKKFL